MRVERNPARALLVWSVRGYQTFVSPALPRSCKYHPSCSQYAIDALAEFGVFRGLVLALWRLLRCNPLSYGGYDPVERQAVFRTTTAPGRGEGDSACGNSKARVGRAAALWAPAGLRHKGQGGALGSAAAPRRDHDRGGLI